MGQLTTDTVGSTIYHLFIFSFILEPIASMAVSGDGKMVLASCLDSTIRLFSKSDGTMYQVELALFCPLRFNT